MDLNSWHPELSEKTKHGIKANRQEIVIGIIWGVLILGLFVMGFQ